MTVEPIKSLGLTGDEYPDRGSFLDDNRTELLALTKAEDGDPSDLAELIISTGALRTKDARRFVSDRLKGLPLAQGRRRTIDQQARDVAVYIGIRRTQQCLGISEYAALKRFLDENPDVNEDTLKSQVRRAKATLEGYFGRRPSPVQVKK